MHLHMRDKVVRLQQNRLMILNTSMMKPIKGYGGDYYELKYSNYRIALYHETATNTFLLLHGFKKERRRERREIERAYSKLREYQSRILIPSSGPDIFTPSMSLFHYYTPIKRIVNM